MFAMPLTSQFTGEQIVIKNVFFFLFLIGHRKRVCADTDQRSHHAT